MNCFVNPFAPDLDLWKPGRCSCGYHESEAHHEKAVALAQSRKARSRFIAETCRSLIGLPRKRSAVAPDDGAMPDHGIATPA